MAIFEKIQNFILFDFDIIQYDFKCKVKEFFTHKKRNQNLEYLKRKEIFDKIKEKYGLKGVSCDDWSNIIIRFNDEIYCIAWLNKLGEDTLEWGYIKEFSLKYPEPKTHLNDCFGTPRWNTEPLDYYLKFDGREYFNDNATFEEVEQIVVKQIARFKEIQIEYKEKKAADDFDEYAAIFEELKEHYHLIELDYPINCVRYAYSTDIKYFVIGYCKARNEIYIPRGLETQQITIAGTTTVKLDNVWEMECREDKLTYTKYEEYKNHIDDILKHYKELELKKWENYEL